MQWWVEVTALDGQTPPVERAVEADNWRDALAGVLVGTRQSPAASGALGLEELGLERLGAGWRVIDAAERRRYLVVPAPPSEVLSALLEADSLGPPVPSYELVVTRDHDPTPELPLVYRERGVRVASNVKAAAAGELLRQLLDQERRALVGFPTGKVIELAAFVGVFPTAELPPPLATLSYRDWRREAVLCFLGEPGRVERLRLGPQARPPE